MKLSGQREKWATVLLAVVCLALVINIAQSSRPVRAGGARPSPSPASPATRRSVSPNHAKEDVAQDDPEVRLGLLKEFQSRPLPELDRNPFEFPPAHVDHNPQPTAPPPTPPPPPPPPPMPIKALGYAEKAGAVREAYVTDDDQVYVVHAGETFAGHFRVLKIDPQRIEIQDDSSRQTAQLPFPQ